MGTAIKHSMPDRVKPAERQSARMSKWRLNPVWHRILYSCTHVATVGVKGGLSLVGGACCTLRSDVTRKDYSTVAEVIFRGHSRSSPITWFSSSVNILQYRSGPIKYVVTLRDVETYRSTNRELFVPCIERPQQGQTRRNFAKAFVMT